MEILSILGVKSIIELITYLIVAVCGVLFIVMKSNPGFKEKYKTIIEVARLAVEAAEKLSKEKGWNGPEKFEYVYNILLKYAKGLEEEEIKAIIESAVYNLDKEKSA